MTVIDTSEENEKRAKKFGYIGLFSQRDSIQEAYDYALELIEAKYPGEQAAALTALHVVTNTHALLMAQRVESVNELRELARATQAYCEQDSRSSRRRAAMIQGAKDAIINAQDVFGDEE